MPETFSPVVLQNNTGQPLNRDYFNRLETNLETFDDRIDANERGIATPVAVSYTPTITVNATLGSLFRVIATGDVTLADPTGGTDGQQITVEIQASGADRTLSFAGSDASGVTIPAGSWWVGRLRYNAATVTWILGDSDTGTSSGGAGSSSSLQVHAVGNSGTALTLDAASVSGAIKTITLTANCTFALTGAVAGQASTLELVLTQDSTGSRVVTWPASVRWAGGAPALTTTAGAVDRIVLVSYNGGTTWYGDLIGRGYA